MLLNIYIRNYKKNKNYSFINCNIIWHGYSVNYGLNFIYLRCLQVFVK